MIKKRAVFLSQIGFLAALAFFVAKRFDTLTADFDLAVLVHKPFPVLMSLAFFVGFYAILAFHWQRICNQIDPNNSRRQALSFLASQPYKYLPTSIFSFSSRAMFAKNLGLSIGRSTVCQLIENFNIVLSAFSVAAIFLTYNYSYLFGTALLVAFLVVLVLISRLGDIKIVRSSYVFNAKVWAVTFGLASVSWLFAGIGLVFLSMVTNGEIKVSAIITANALAISLGILAVFAPGGLGVREIVYLKFGLASPLIILWRLLTLIVDVVTGLAAVAIMNHSRGKAKQ